MKNSLSYIGGLLSIALGVYGIFLGIVFPFIFKWDITNYFLEREMLKENDSSSNNVNQKSDLKDRKNLMKDFLH